MTMTFSFLVNIILDFEIHIRNCTELAETFEEMLKVHKNNLNSLTAEKEKIEKIKTEEMAKEEEKKKEDSE